MLPTLKSGDAVLINKSAQPAVGNVVLAYHPFKLSVKIVKRVSDVGDDGSLTLAGDNPSESTDSRSFGTISARSVIGKVTCRLK